MEQNIFTDKSEEEARSFYYTTKGVYKAKLEILESCKVELDEMLKREYQDKSKVKKLKDLIKKLEIEITTIEYLYKSTFDQVQWK